MKPILATVAQNYQADKGAIRICIARAVLNNPPIMLLDEATSALDTESEKLVQDALNNLMKNPYLINYCPTVLMYYTRNADIIIVLENGKVVEQGNHHQHY